MDKTISILVRRISIGTASMEMVICASKDVGFLLQEVLRLESNAMLIEASRCLGAKIVHEIRNVTLVD